LVDQNRASWNHLGPWLNDLAALRVALGRLSFDSPC